MKTMQRDVGTSSYWPARIIFIAQGAQTLQQAADSPPCCHGVSDCP